MRVVAHTGEHTVLVEANIEELVQIEGLASSWELPRERKTYDGRAVAGVAYPVGRRIEIHKLWKIIEHERGRPNEISNTAKNLRSLADMLDIVNEALPMPSVEPVAVDAKEG